MKDLTSRNAFESQKKLFNNVIKHRKIDIENYDDFLDDLRKQKQEAEREKDADLSLGSYKNQLNNEHFQRNQLLNDNYDDAIKKLGGDFNSPEVQVSQGWDDSISNNDSMTQSQQSLIQRITVDLKNNLDTYFQEQDAFYQDKATISRLTKKRQLLSQWNGLLYSSRLLSGVALGSLVNLLVAIPRFKIFPFEMLVGAVVELVIKNNKLRKFHDGLFCGNWSLNNKNIKPLLKKNHNELIKASQQSQDEQDQEEEQRAVSLEQNNGSSEFDFGGMNFDDDFDDNFNLGGEGFGDQDLPSETPSFSGANSIFGRRKLDEEDTEEETTEAHYVAKPTSNSRSNSDFLTQLNLDCREVINQENISPSYIKFKNKEYDASLFHRQAMDYLNSLYANRKELGQKAKTREDFMRIFSPIIAKFNDEFGKKDKIDFNDAVVDNVAFALFLTFKEINNRYRSISKKDFNPDFYIFVGNATQTALYYKIEFKLPSLININEFRKNLSVLKRYLKKDNTDKAVQLSIETSENGGALKIFKVRANDEGTILLPAVSSGDILRFKGMSFGKTKDGRPISLLEAMSSAGDFKSMIGVREGEYPVIQDLGASSNSNIFICADTGAGKTIAIKSILENSLWVYSPDEVGFIIFDVKSGQDWKQFRYLPHVLGWFGEDDFENYTDILQMIKAINSARHEYMDKTVRSGMADFAKTRIKYSKQGDWEKLMTVPHLYIICDEQLDLLQDLDELDIQNKMKNSNRDKDEEKLSVDNKRRYKASVNGMANKFREQGISFIFISQKADDEAIPRKAMLSASIAFFMLGHDDEVQRKYKNFYGSVENLPVGSGYFFARGKYSSGVKVNVSLTSGSPEASLEYTRILAIAWNILESGRGKDMFNENVGFCTQVAEKNNSSLPRAVNRPDALVEIVEQLYNGDIFITKDKNINQNIDIVDDVLENISPESKRRFPKQYRKLVAIKYPEEAQNLPSGDEPVVSRSKTPDKINKEEQENQYYQEMKQKLANQKEKTNIEDDSNNFTEVNSAGDIPSDDDTFTEDEVADQEELMAGVVANDFFDDSTDEIISGFSNNLPSKNVDEHSENQEEIPSLSEVLNEEIDDEEQEELPTPEVKSTEETIDDGTHDVPQTFMSIDKYFKAHHLTQVKLSKLRELFSDNTINSAVEKSVIGFESTRTYAVYMK